jgi:hypothetical protein
MQEDTTRSLWIAYGLAIMMVGFGFIFGGPYWGVEAILIGIILIARGHFPTLFSTSGLWISWIVGALILTAIVSGFGYRAAQKLKPSKNIIPSASEIADEVAKKLPQAKFVPTSDTQPKEQSPQPSPKKPAPIEPPQRPYDLTGPRRKKFLELLGRAQSEPRDTVRIGCISWSDAACVAAGRFLILFSEAGWMIDSDRVFRMEPYVPMEGMAMVTHVDDVGNAQKLPPHLGTWQKMDASQVTIYWAFKGMGIPVSSSGDQSLPAGTLGIYFGPEPQSH